MNEINMNGEDELENISSDIYEDHADIVTPDKNHPVQDTYQYEEGEGNADTQSNQRDVADTGEHGLGGGDASSSIDNSNVEASQDEEEADEENKNNLRII